MAVKVGIEIRAIPDGYFAGKPVISLVIMPAPLSTATAEGIDLAEWPQRIHELSQHTMLHVQKTFAVGRRERAAIAAGESETRDWAAINAHWMKMIGLDDEEAAIAEVFKPVDKMTEPDKEARKVSGEGAYQNLVYSYPAVELANTLTTVSGALSALQLGRFLDDDDRQASHERKTFTKSLNPLSRSALQSSVTMSLFGLGRTQTIAELSREIGASPPRGDAIESPSVASIVTDALRRIAWAGRQTPQPRIAALLVTATEAQREAEAERRYRATIDGVSVSANLAEAIAGQVSEAVSIQAAAQRAVNNLDIEVAEDYRAYDRLFRTFIDPASDRDADGTEGFFSTFNRYETQQPIIWKRIGEALWGGNDTDPVPGSPGFLNKAAELGDPVRALARYEFTMMPERSSFLESMSARNSPLPKDAAQRSEEPPEAEASSPIVRRLTGLLAYPDVARFFGMIVDIHIDSEVLINAVVSKLGISELGGDLEFQIQCEFARGSGRGPPEQKSTPTVCRLNPRTVRFDPQTLYGKVSSYSKKPISTDFDRIANLEGGLFKLGKAGLKAFALDVNAATEGSVHAARNDQKTLENGEFITALPSSQPTERTAGIVLADDNVVLKAKLEQIVAMLREKKGEGTIEKPEWTDSLFLEDLVAGYRIDVGTHAQDSDKPKWSSLTNRNVRFPEIDELPGGAELSSELSRARERMNGYVRTVHREYDVGDPKPKAPNAAAVYETLTTWRNWSLAVPASDQTQVICAEDLRLSTEISLPTERGKKLPKLRFGAKYSFGARYVLINGSSLSLIEAKERYDDDKLAVIQHGFERHEPIAAPEVRYLSNIAHSAAEDAPVTAEERKFEEQAETIIVFAGREGEVKERYLLAGSRPVDFCELHGALDHASELPANSYGDLPLRPRLKPVPANPVEQYYLKQPKVPAPYYVDPMAREMVLGFFVDGELGSAPHYPPPVKVDLYSGRRTWPKARLVRLEVRIADSAGPHAGSSQRAAIWVDGVAGDGTIHVIVEIEPAEIADLRIFCVPKEMSELRHHAGVQNLLKAAGGLAASLHGYDINRSSPKAARLKQLGAALGRISGADLIYTTLGSIPLPSVAHVASLELIHAVERPLAPPEFENFWLIHQQVADPASAESEPGTSPADESKPVDPGGADETVREEWRKLIATKSLKADSFLPEDLRRSGAPGSQRVLIGGSLKFHRMSTSKLELRASWADFRADIPPRMDASNVYRFIPDDGKADLLIENIPYRLAGEVGGGSLDLVFDEFERPRILFMPLQGTHARRMKVMATGVSRFSKYFKDERGTVDARVEASEGWSIMCPATARPEKVNLQEASTALHEEGGRVFDLKALGAGLPVRPLGRKVSIRLDLGMSWYSAGEGELLGVVLWPPATPGVTCGGIPKFATSWGRDPIRLTGDVTRLVHAAAIVNCTAFATAFVPEPLEKEEAPGTTPPPSPKARTTTPASSELKFVKCTLALFEPQVDSVTGHFYIDVEIDAGNSYNAFVRLGLVRYQPNSLRLPQDLEVSFPIEKMISVMPARKLEASLNATGGIVLTYTGTGYNGINTGDTDQALREILNTSTIDVVVLRRLRRPGHSGVPAATRSGATMEVAEIKGIEPIDPPGFDFTWKFQIDIIAPGEECPACRDHRQITIEKDNVNRELVVLIRELEHYPADVSAEQESPEQSSIDPNSGALSSLNTKVISRVVSSFAVTLEGELAETVGDKWSATSEAWRKHESRI